MTVSSPDILEGEVQGRPIKFRRPNETQLALMNQHAQIADRSLVLVEKLVKAAEEGDEGAKERAGSYFLKSLGGIGEILDIIGFLVVEPEDVDWLVLGMKSGVVGVVDLMEMMQKGNGSDRRPAKKAVGGKARRTGD